MFSFWKSRNIFTSWIKLFYCGQSLSRFKKGKHLSFEHLEEYINDVIEDGNNDEVNVADDDKIKHESSLV